MNVLELDRHPDRIAAGEARLAHMRYVVVTRSAHGTGIVGNGPPVYTVWLSAEREVGESRFCLTQTTSLGFAAQIARAATNGNSEQEPTR